MTGDKMSELMLINPRARKARGKKKAAPSRKHNPAPAKKRRTKRRHNPVVVASAKRGTKRRHNPISSNTMTDQLKNAFMGGLGGLVVDVVAGKIIPKLPAPMQGGYMGKVLKVGLAFGLGALAQKSKMLKGSTATALVEGALTVEMYDLIRNVAHTAMPNLAMGEYLPSGEYIPTSEYVPTDGADDYDFSGATTDKLLSGSGDRNRSDATFLSGDDDEFNGLDDGLGDYDDEMNGMADDFAGVDSPFDGSYARFPSSYNI
jgi:hypothetical protein